MLLVVSAVRRQAMQVACRSNLLHGGGANVLFGDGHVTWYLHQDLVVKWPVGPGDALKQRLWNIDNEPDKKW